MFLNFQTKSDIRRIIIESMMANNGPMSAQEVADWIWHRCLIDGLRSGVGQTVRSELQEMYAEGLLSRFLFGDVRRPSPAYVNSDVLTVMAILTK